MSANLSSSLPIWPSMPLAQTPGAALRDACAVALVCMPWGSLIRPGIAMGILKQCAASAGYHADLHYLNVAFAQMVGLKEYEDISVRANLYPEWFFSPALFGSRGSREICNDWNDLKADPLHSDMVAGLLNAAGESEEFCTRIVSEYVPRFIEDCLTQTDWKKYRVVGFTTTFAQSVASLLLAKLIKQESPGTAIVFGGANVDSEMGVEIIRGFPWVDYVVHGEAENSFPALLHSIAAGDLCARIPGISMRIDGTLVPGHGDAQPVVNLNDTLAPDYDDFVLALRRHGLNKKMNMTLYYESSRGCWWGAKHHCTFCGLNGKTMAYRRKTSARVYDEILALATRYQCLSIAAADNIFPMEFFSELLPRLTESGLDLSLFYEMKANLTKQQVRSLRDAGITAITPGIESFSTRILKLMRKGVTGIQNIQTLKWCREYGIETYYNVLYGFPGEAAEDYRDFPSLFLALSHLRPPGTVGPIVFERFSPYFFEREKHNVRLSPATAYKMIFPENRVNLERLAYFYDAVCEGQPDPSSYAVPMQDVWKEWSRHWEEQAIFCYYERGPEFLVIHDNRPAFPGARLARRQVQLSGWTSSIYRFCEENRSFRAIAKMVREEIDATRTEDEIRDILNQLVRQRLMFREEERYLALATHHRPPRAPGLQGGSA